MSTVPLNDVQTCAMYIKIPMIYLVSSLILCHFLQFEERRLSIAFHFSIWKFSCETLSIDTGCANFIFVIFHVKMSLEKVEMWFLETAWSLIIFFEEIFFQLRSYWKIHVMLTKNVFWENKIHSFIAYSKRDLFSE